LSYLPHAIDSRKDLQYIAPKLGIDLPYWKKYFSYHKAFNVRVYGYFDGSINSTYVLETDDDVDLEEYYGTVGYGYHLIDSNNVDYGEISGITYISGVYSLITVPVAVANGSFSIAKYYESKLETAPVIRTDTVRTGELARTGTFEFTINNAGTVVNAQETIDISCVGGLNTVGKMSVSDSNWAANYGTVPVYSMQNDVIYKNTGTAGVFLTCVIIARQVMHLLHV